MSLDAVRWGIQNDSFDHIRIDDLSDDALEAVISYFDSVRRSMDWSPRMNAFFHNLLRSLERRQRFIDSVKARASYYA
jgi:hypothetical protein